MMKSQIRKKKNPWSQVLTKIKDQPPCMKTGSIPYDKHWVHDKNHKHCRLEVKPELKALLKHRSFIANNDFGSEGELNLRYKAQEVNMSRVGVDSTYRPEFLTEEKYIWIKRFAVAQALIDYIARTEAGISLRWIVPDLDFCDGNFGIIKNRDWTFPVNKWYEVLWNTDPEDKKRKYIEKETIIRTDFYRQNSRKVYIIFGLTLVGPSASTCIDFCRGDIKIIEVISTVSLPPDRPIGLDLPILYKRGDEMRIRTSLTPDSEGKREKIIFHGFVAEALGTSQAG